MNIQQLRDRLQALLDEGVDPNLPVIYENESAAGYGSFDHAFPSAYIENGKSRVCLMLSPFGEEG